MGTETNGRAEMIMGKHHQRRATQKRERERESEKQLEPEPEPELKPDPGARATER